MVTHVVNEPLEVMAPLVDFRPDLILMDVYMPGCDGMDLAAVIRQQEDYVGIPIVFLSTETNPDMHQEALRMGGDDFLTKPIPPDRLIVSITSRVQRSRALRSLMVRDSLTGLLNHTAVKERLSAEIARARRGGEHLALAVIDIDHFKSVNDTYGHPTGDRVLKSLSRLLQQRLRKSDIIGRYGGEEFVVILGGTDGASAVGVLDEIRAHLAHIRQQAEGAEFSVTFSCGIADFPTYADATDLTQAADKALYEAKRAGRNRVILAE
jgi:diguanylate cyclase (GGDEF)-like protein